MDGLIGWLVAVGPPRRPFLGRYAQCRREVPSCNRDLHLVTTDSFFAAALSVLSTRPRPMSYHRCRIHQPNARPWMPSFSARRMIDRGERSLFCHFLLCAPRCNGDEWVIAERDDQMSKKVSYSASLVTQGEHRFYQLAMPSETLAKCSFVTTRDEDPDKGFQRMLDEKRAIEIARYIDSGLGTIPTSIILSAQEIAELGVKLS